MAFPTTLTGAQDGVTEIIAAHLNNLEAKVGIDSSAVATSLDYLLRNTASIEPGHKHSKLWASDGSPEAVSVDAAGKVGLGTQTPQVALDIRGSAGIFKGIAGTGILNSWYGLDYLTSIFQTDAGTYYGMAYVGAGNNSFAVWQEYINTRSVDGTTPGILQASDELGVFNFIGDDGVTLIPGASIRAHVAAAPSAGVMPGQLSFWTTQSGTLIERMTISYLGKVGIGTAASGVAISEKFTVQVASDIRFGVSNVSTTGVVLYAHNDAWNGYKDLSFNGYVLIQATSQNVGIGTTSFGSSAVKTLSMGSGTAPSTFPADAAQMCVKDQAAGNACFHFYTELGQIIKLYQQAHLADLNAAYGAGDLDTEAEVITALNLTNAKINSILSYLENLGFNATA